MIYNQRGSVTAMGLLLALCFTIMLAGLVPMISTEVRFTKNNQDIVAAQYAAEAGAKRAISGIAQKSSTWNWLGVNQNLHDSLHDIQYNVTTQPPLSAVPATGTPYKITSIGISGSAKKTVVVYATLPTPSGGGIVVNDGAANVKTIVANNSLNGTNANIYTSDAFPSGLINSGNGKRVGNSPFAMPTFDYAAFKAQASPLPTIQQNQNYLNTGNSLYYYDGNLNITQSNVQIIGSTNGTIIFASGNITLDASSLNINTGKVFFVSNGTITVKQNPNLNNVGLIAQGDVTFTAGMKFKSSIIVTPKTLTITGQTNFDVTDTEAQAMSAAFNNIMSKYGSGGSGGGGGSSGGSSGDSEISVIGWSS